MSNSYTYDGGDPAPETVNLTVLPEGDYKFYVAEFNEPYQKPDGKWVAKAKLVILPDDKQPGNQWVWANPWSGVDRNGKKRDGIGTFLNCVNRAPKKKGETPDWDNIVSARGKCHLRIRPNQVGQDQNEVGWFITPKPLDQQPENKMTFKKEDLDAALESDDEPDSIPF